MFLLYIVFSLPFPPIFTPNKNEHAHIMFLFFLLKTKEKWSFCIKHFGIPTKINLSKEKYLYNIL